jgi:bacterial/archaeal transporter family protein
MWWIYAFLSALFAAATAILAKKGLTAINPNLATGIRTIVILIMIWGIVLFRGEARGFSGMSRQHLFLVAGVDKLSLVLTVVFAVVFLGEAISVKTAIGMCLIISGTVLLILK